MPYLLSGIEIHTPGPDICIVYNIPKDPEDPLEISAIRIGHDTEIPFHLIGPKDALQYEKTVQSHYDNRKNQI